VPEYAFTAKSAPGLVAVPYRGRRASSTRVRPIWVEGCILATTPFLGEVQHHLDHASRGR
jgi:hypothetical protein